MNDNEKYLGLTGLTFFWEKLKVKLSLKADKTELPTKTSQLTNDSGFITLEEVPEGAAASGTVPKMDGEAAAGSEETFARGDHIHPTDTSRLATDGEAGSTTVTFNTAAARTALISGEKLAVLLGKIAKYLVDLGALAFKSTVARTDLAPEVQNTLNKADTALQSFTETDPTVPAWAKAVTKPTYTAAEVGALTFAEAESIYAKKTDIAGVYKYKGSKATAEELPDTGNENGDVWNVEETDMNYGWTGSAWDPLGQSFGVASMTTEEIEAILAE